MFRIDVLCLSGWVSFYKGPAGVSDCHLNSEVYSMLSGVCYKYLHFFVL